MNLSSQQLSDITFMQRAIDLAYKGRFTTTPNPNVGCVIVNQGNIVGEGFHYRAGEGHAEVHALKMAGEQARNGTAYVTLEPCSHFGRTPPCSDALIQAGIKRVVVAMRDPNPLVSGKGIARLQAAGVEVIENILAEASEKLNAGFLKRMRTGMPYVQLKLAASLDGKTAMASGESKWITSAFARQDVQVFRAQSSAMLSSSATVLADDPSLNVRYDELPDDIKSEYPESALRQPVRVIIDSKHRLSGQEKVFQLAGDVWLARKTNTSPEGSHCQLLVDDSPSKEIDLHALMAQLGERQINTVWVEAGAQLAGALIEQNLVDELIIYMAPKLLGSDARGLCVLPHLTQLTQAPTFRFTDIKQIGSDIRLILTR